MNCPSTEKSSSSKLSLGITPEHLIYYLVRSSNHSESVLTMDMQALPSSKSSLIPLLLSCAIFKHQKEVKQNQLQ